MKFIEFYLKKNKIDYEKNYIHNFLKIIVIGSAKQRGAQIYRCVMCRLYSFLYLIVLMWQVRVHMSSPKLSKLCVCVCVCVCVCGTKEVH